MLNHKTTLIIIFICTLLMSCTLLDDEITLAPEDTYRMIDVPAVDICYSEFESMVIETEIEQNEFLNDTTRSIDICTRFLTTLEEAEISYAREALVLLTHTENSGSNIVTFWHPALDDDRLICRISREVPDNGTDDMAYYCFALAVNKSKIVEVEWIESDDRKTLIRIDG